MLKKIEYKEKTTFFQNKIFHGTILTVLFYVITIFLTYFFSKFFYGVKWYIPFVIGVIFTVLSFVFFAIAQNHEKMSIFCFFTNTLSFSLYISAFMDEKKSEIYLLPTFISCGELFLCFCFFSVLCNIFKKSKLQTTLVSIIFSVVYIIAVVFSGIHFAKIYGNHIDFVFAMYAIVQVFMTFGCYVASYDFWELLSVIALPMNFAVLIVGIIVLLAIGGGDGCDCDGGCCDGGCCDGDRGAFSRNYKKTKNPFYYSDMPKWT